MFNRFTLINILLVTILLFLARQTLQIWSHGPKEENSSPTRKTTEKAGQFPLVQRVSPPKDSFQVISEKNLFHPQRKWGKEVKEEEKNQSLFPQQEVAKEITLYGILIFGDYRVAVLGEGNVPDQNKGIRKVGIGDSIAGYQVEEISADKVTLRNGNQTKIIPLYKQKTNRRIYLGHPVTYPPIIPPMPPPPVSSRTNLSRKKSLPEIFMGTLQKQ